MKYAGNSEKGYMFAVLKLQTQKGKVPFYTVTNIYVNVYIWTNHFTVGLHKQRF